MKSLPALPALLCATLFALAQGAFLPGALAQSSQASQAGTTGQGQAYPHRPVTVVVPFVPGGSSDTTMRAASQKLAEQLGQPVVLDNKPGANGTIGAGIVQRAAPDGYTLLIGSVGTYAITPTLIRTTSYDARKDFDLLTIAVRTPNVIVVTPSFPASTVAELIAEMKRQPGRISFANSGPGSTDHLTSALLWQKTGTEGMHVPYKGGGAAITDVMAGHANVLITNLGVISNHIQAGKLKPLAVTSAKRLPELPNVPTMAEAGVDGLEVYSWQGIAAPKGLPPAIRDQLSTALVKTFRDPQVSRNLEAIGYEIVASTPDGFRQELDVEIARWKAVIDSAGIKVD